MEEKKKMPKWLIIVIVIFVIGVVGAALGNDEKSNSGDSTKQEDKAVSKEEGCYMTIEKFNQISNGMSYDEVKNIIGCDGKLSTEASAGDQNMKIYYWYAKNGISNATFSFQNDVLNAKSQIGLE